MKVYAYINIADKLKGDIIYIYPMVEDQGKLTLNKFIPVVIDLNIPCGDAFNKLEYNCVRCKDNDWETCDKIKYERAVWSAGDILNPPKVIKRRRYMIDRTEFISGESELLITKADKTEQEKLTIITNAKNNEQLKTVIIEKVVK